MNNPLTDVEPPTDCKSLVMLQAKLMGARVRCGAVGMFIYPPNGTLWNAKPSGNKYLWFPYEEAHSALNAMMAGTT